MTTHQTPVLDEGDRDALEGAFARSVTFAAKQIVVRQGVPLTQCTLLQEGFVERFKDLPDGRRQILAIHIPGDFIDLHSYPLKKLEHNVAALTAIKVAMVPHPAMRALTEKSATLTELLWRST
ncbi:MAG: cyclic nucleotide-binding domain-containing protein, partial [Sphingomonas sp.]